MQTVIGAFDDRAQAQRAVDRLVQEGFARDDVHVEQQDTEAGGASVGQAWDGQEREVAADHRGGFFARLFGLDDDDRDDDNAGTYHEAVRRGSSVVVVDARDDAQAERAVTCLHDLGAMDVDERAQTWRAEGWTGGELRDDAPPAGKDGVLDVVQEELQVGKRRLDKGGVRVVQRVTEQPVREVVRLREERAVVARRAVDRPATAGDMNAFHEGTLEVRESAEEPVVAKTARVVEEVRVGKEVREREEAIEDKVRRKDVDVERLQGGGRTNLERERAVASDRDAAPSTPRDPDAGGGTLTGGSGRARRNDPLA